MSDSRAAILGRIRQSLRTAHLPDAGDLPPLDLTGLARTPVRRPDRSALIDQFIAALEAVGGEAVRAADADEGRARLLDLLRQSEAREALVWPDEELPFPIGDALRAEGVAPVLARLDGDPARRQAQLDALDRPAVGVTGALAGLADTGSVALLSGPRRPMTASLLPLTHVALLREGDIVADMATFLAPETGFLGRNPVSARNLVFITGPSRTADIEMVITRGVHGPRRVVVVVVE